MKKVVCFNIISAEAKSIETVIKALIEFMFAKVAGA